MDRNVLFGTYKVLQKLDREVGTDGKMLCNDKSSNNPWPGELKSSKGNNSNMTSKVFLNTFPEIL
jgi:hypothetical protein